MGRKLFGLFAADALSDRLALRVEALRSKGVRPTLAIVRVGERPDDLSYERGALKRCDRVGIDVKCATLPSDCTQGDLLGTINGLNVNPHVHGILMFRPLPDHLDEEGACATIDPAKDVDGVTAGSLFGVFTNRPTGFAPCTAEAVIELLRAYGYEIEGANVCVIGRSLVIGKPVSMLLQAANATVTMCHRKTRDLDAICRNSDIVVVSAGCPNTFRASAAAPGQVVIDVGINWDEATHTLCGDVDFEAVEPLVAAITPVPRGIGSVTTAILAKHVVEAAERLVG